jgi:hypothetical protein
MSYSLHIERIETNPGCNPAPLSVEEWREAVAATEGIRLAGPGQVTFANPKTKEGITFPKRENDVEVFFPRDQQWYLAFCWHDQSASFAARSLPDDPSDPVWVAALALAHRLGAAVRGDEGEYYFPPMSVGT